MTPIMDQNSANGVESFADWSTLPTGTYLCRAIICSEVDGGFSAYAARLPGVVSEGDTFDEAVANVAEAFRGAVESYLTAGASIPWVDEDPVDPGVQIDIPVTLTSRG